MKFMHQMGAWFIFIMFLLQLLSNWRIAKDVPLYVLARKMEWAKTHTWPRVQEYLFRQSDARKGKYGSKVQQEAKAFSFFQWFGVALALPNMIHSIIQYIK